MFNKKSFEVVEQAIFKGKFKNVVDDYCLSNIPGTILSNFGVESKKCLPNDVFGKEIKQYDKVVLFVIDAFGYTFFEKFFEKSTFLKRIVSEGVVSKLTTQFPSTTTANVTTLHTGIPVSESGVIEWNYYEPRIDAVYSPLLFKKAGESELLNIDASELLPIENIYQKLNVASYVFQYQLYNEGPYSKLMHKGSETISFQDIDEGLSQLKKILQLNEKSYSYFYHSDFDSVLHEFGPESLQAEACFDSIFNSLDTFFEEVKLENTLILLTADHGQTTVIKENAIYLNLEFPEILPYLKKNQAGEFIIPCGSFRDMFLYIEKEHIEDICHFLQKNLIGKAEVYKVEELIKKGVFGHEKPSKEFLDRVGDIVILPYRDQAVWWYEENKFFVKHQGMHGGLTKEEMEIPFLVYQCK